MDFCYLSLQARTINMSLAYTLHGILTPWYQSNEDIFIGDEGDVLSHIYIHCNSFPFTLWPLYGCNFAGQYPMLQGKNV